MYHSAFKPVGDWHTQPLESLHPQPPAALLPWLLHPGSLTAALKHLSDNRFHVQILSQRWQRPDVEERRALGLHDRSRALIREVLLCGCERPWVYARSVLPLRSLQGKSRYLRSLDSRPLGELLFGEPGISRGPIAVNCLRRNPHCQLPELTDETQNAWGRRSIFWLRDKPLLVAETFLSDFQPHSGPHARRQAGVETAPETGGLT